MHKVAKQNRLRDLSIYVAISASIIGGIFATANAGVAWHVVFAACCLAAYTLLLFGYFIADSRLWWQKRSFWLLTLVLLSVHFVCLAVILAHLERFRPFWFVAAIPEFVIVVLCRNMILPINPLGQHSKSMKHL